MTPPPDSTRRWVLVLSGTLLVTAGAAVALWLQAPSAPTSELARTLATVGARIDAPPTMAVLNVSAPGGHLESILAADGEDRLRIRVSGGLDAAAAADRVRTLRGMIEGLFEDHQIPYPGELSHTLQCPEKYRPADVADRGAALGLLQLYANDRLAFGGCSADLLRYHATIGYFHSPAKQNLFTVEYFAATGGQDAGLQIVRSFRAGPEDEG